jgi:hypothetical protein
MSEITWEGLEDWLGLRKEKLKQPWTDALRKEMGDQNWSLELHLGLDEAIDKQVRAECLACLYGKPLPDGKLALDELVLWRRTNEFSVLDDMAIDRLAALVDD